MSTLSFKRHPGADTCSRSWYRLDVESPTNESHSLLHAHETETFVVITLAGLIESYTIVADLKLKAALEATEVDPHLGGLGMTEYVPQTLLRHAIQAGRDFLWEWFRCVAVDELPPHGRSSCEVIKKPLQCN